jgi:hypothetical protein
MLTSTRLLTLALCSSLVLAGCFGGNSDDNGQTSSDNGVTSSTDVPMGDIVLYSPLPNETVMSPLIVTGTARGTWYFEASFPVRLLDGNGNEIAITPAQAQGDWMTTDYVPFTAVLEFAQPATPNGTLVLQKDNPSGLPENEASLEIPVMFQ